MSMVASYFGRSLSGPDVCSRPCAGTKPDTLKADLEAANQGLGAAPDWNQTPHRAWLSTGGNVIPWTLVPLLWSVVPERRVLPWSLVPQANI